MRDLFLSKGFRWTIALTLLTLAISLVAGGGTWASPSTEVHRQTVPTIGPTVESPAEPTVGPAATATLPPAEAPVVDIRFEGEAEPGAELDMTVEVRNLSSQTLTSVWLVLGDVEGLTFSNIAVDSGSWEMGSIIWNIGELLAGQGCTLTAVATVGEEVMPETVLTVPAELTWGETGQLNEEKLLYMPGAILPDTGGW